MVSIGLGGTVCLWGSKLDRFLQVGVGLKLIRCEVLYLNLKDQLLFRNGMKEI